VEDTEDTEDTKAPQPEGKGERASIENLRVLENIEVRMTVEVGRTEITIRDLLR